MRNRLMAGVVLAAALSAGAASADPFAISYTGTMLSSAVPEITAGQTYDVTLVFDNGGSTAASQTWTTGDLQCVIYRFNTARNVVFTQDLVANAPTASTGSASTNAAGLLLTNFDQVIDYPTSSGLSYTGTIRPSATYQWFANGFNGVFSDLDEGDVNDQAGGVLMAAANWTSPTPFSGDCAGRQIGAVVPPAPVPTMSEWALILMGLLLAGAAALLIGRRQQTV